MDSFKNVLLYCFGMALSIYLSIMVGVKGWGLEPKSYFWIIGVGFFWASFCKNNYTIII